MRQVRAVQGWCCRAGEQAGKGDQSRCRCCSRQESISPTLRKAAWRLQAPSILPVREKGVTHCGFAFLLAYSSTWSSWVARGGEENQMSRRQELRGCVKGEGAGHSS